MDEETKNEERIEERHNFKCASCKRTFLLRKDQKMIQCAHCGYRILLKVRTANYIMYKTE